jgi:hypothetical protein
MVNELLLPFAVILSLTAWAAIKHAIAVAQSRRQIEIARSGRSCQGKLVAVQHPFMLDTCTRYFFDYVPQGGERPVRACHVDRRSTDKGVAAFPATGSIVTVQYLPNRPKHAVISRLVSRPQ